MSKTTDDITIVAGDDRSFEVEIVECNEETGEETPRNITGYSLRFLVKRSPKNADSDALLDIEWDDHYDPENGKSLMELTHELTAELPTGNHTCALRWEDPGGKVRTVFSNKVFNVTY